MTGRTYGEEIRRRVITPLGLRETYVPGDASAIPGPHPRGYVRPGVDAPLRDITAINPSVAGPSGELISSGSDVNRFLAALLRGELLRPAQLREMAWRAGHCPVVAATGGTPVTFPGTRRRAAPRSTAGRRRSW
ncbi:serine hydrolase [Streptomyces sp. NPDC012935]|uniref:serine hydrolase n=1 Tax=Streptomyces sp. NPDC012935 TaxID=3364857 RepID=UPI00369D9050